MKKVAIIATCYNEAANIVALYQRITAAMKTVADLDYEIIFIDNASTDNSYALFQHVIAADARCKALIMSRNFGSNQPSILAGMRHAQADAVIIISGDIQDPPEVIPTFIERWRQGFDVVYGVAKKRKGGILRRIGYRCFYRVLKQLSYLDIPLDGIDFSLMDHKVVAVLKHLPEKDLYIRGLRAWAGFAQTGVDFVREDRAGGRTSNSFFANFMWAKKAIVNFSYKPLVYITRLATLSVFATFCAACLFLYWHFAYGAPRGFSTLLMTMFLFGTVQLLALATIGEYMIKIFEEVKGRPPYVIREILQQPVASTAQFIPAFYEAAAVVHVQACLPKHEQEVV